MITRIYRSYMNGSMLDLFTDLNFDSSYESVSSDEFIIRYQDVEPKMVIQFLISQSSEEVPLTFDTVQLPLSLTTYSDVSLLCSMGYKTTLLGNINSLTDKLISTYDKRYNTQSSLVINSEKMLIIDVTHDVIQNKSILKVQRSGTPASHYMDSEIKVVRSYPSMSVYNRSLGMVQIDWSQLDTDSPGSYELEVTVSRGYGSNYLKWSVAPIRVKVESDYNLS